MRTTITFRTDRPIGSEQAQVLWSQFTRFSTLDGVKREYQVVADNPDDTRSIVDEISTVADLIQALVEVTGNAVTAVVAAHGVKRVEP